VSLPFPTIPRERLAPIYIGAVIVSGFALLAALLVTRGPALVHHLELPVIVLVVAIVAGEVIPVKLDRGEGELVLSTTFMFALLLFGGIGAAVLTQAFASTLADRINNKRLLHWAFNIGQYTIAISTSGAVFELLGGLATDGRFSVVKLASALVAAGVFFVINSGAVSTVIALTSGSRVRDEFSGELMRQGSTESILLGLAPLTVLAVHSSAALVVLLALPLLAVRRAGTHALVSRRLALHDALTGLPNRVLFADRTRRAIATADRSDAPVIVMLIDLDRFKDINDTLGHHYGDEVLRQMADRLTSLLDPRDTVARLGGDEFAVLVRSVKCARDGMAVAAAIRRALAEPFTAEGVSLELGGSVGVACHPADGEDVETLMQRADVAMYQAKEGATGVERYSVQEDDSSLERLALAADLRRALERSEFIPYFQPKLDLRTGRVSGAEALLRWKHPSRADVSPDVFIPLAEQTGLIVPVTLQVIAAAVRECSVWRAHGHDLSVAVNLSARALVDPGLPDHVEELCRCWDLPTRALTLEITESMIVDDPGRALPVVERLAALGVRLSIDDFGTGYSSLEYLKVLPVREMKIDRSFVAGMADDPRDAAIVRHSIDLGRSLGLRVVAEGVESAEAHERLAAMGCDQGQGFYYARALPAEDFEPWLAQVEGRWDAAVHADDAPGPGRDAAGWAAAAA
jgi:diguanylate cyclase (GGDEF)-like protein